MVSICYDPVIPAHAGIQGECQGGGMKRQPCVYLLASKRNGTLYTGVTFNLLRSTIVWSIWIPACAGMTGSVKSTHKFFGGFLF